MPIVFLHINAISKPNKRSINVTGTRKGSNRNSANFLWSPLQRRWRYYNKVKNNAFLDIFQVRLASILYREFLHCAVIKSKSPCFCTDLSMIYNDHRAQCVTIFHLGNVWNSVNFGRLQIEDLCGKNFGNFTVQLLKENNVISWMFKKHMHRRSL